VILISVFERSETYTHWSTIRDKDGVAVDPTNVKITIYDPCDNVIVNDQLMTKSDTGIYYYEHILSSTASYGNYRTTVKATAMVGQIGIMADEFFVMPWKVEQDVRRKIGLGDDADISDSDLSHLSWSSYKQALVDLYIHRYMDIPKGDPDTGNKWNGTNLNYQTPQYPIADVNGDGTVSGNTVDCTKDMDVWWIDTDGYRQEGLVTVTNSDHGEINISQVGGAALPSTTKHVYLDYWTVPQNYDEFIFREAVAYLAAHHVELRLEGREKLTIADINANSTILIKSPQRYYREYRRLMRLINKPKIGGG